MNIVRTKEEISEICRKWHSENLTVAIVPTMGYLHEGHLSLIRLARQNADRVVVSVFVNPTQFGPGEDFETYPRDEARDTDLCRKEGADAVFMPAPAEMYRSDKSVSLVENRLSKVMCGMSRPTHFNGVLTVVCKLFNITGADCAVFGMKDAQQLAIIKRMVRDLDMPIKIIPAPIVRESDGLAKSSRNTYLSAEERKDAVCLRRALDIAESEWKSGEKNPDEIIHKMADLIKSVRSADIDYISAVDSDTLEAVKELRPGTLVALAVKIGTTRLIDNTVLS